MDTAQVIERLRASHNRAAIHRATGIDYMHLSRIAWGKIESPGSLIIDKLRDYFAAEDAGTPQ